jgi:hypothetical protein
MAADREMRSQHSVDDARRFARRFAEHTELIDTASVKPESIDD